MSIAAKSSVRTMFDTVAPKYDLLNHLLSAGIDKRWRRQAVAAMALSAGDKVLDLCTGTADLALEAESTGAEVVGVDLAREMLVHGQGKVAGRGVQLVHGDAEHVPVTSSSFDAVCVGFGIRNVENIEAAFAEAHRALKSGGRFVILEFTTPPHPVMRSLYHSYFRQVLPRIGKMISGHPDAYTYLPNSVAQFPRPDVLASMLEHAGFIDVNYKHLTAGIVCLHSASR